MASHSIYTVPSEALRSSAAIEAAELLRSRSPWPEIGCPRDDGSGPPMPPGALCIRYRGAMAVPGVCLDERPIPLAVLSAYSAEEIHSIDYVGGPWPQVRVYTERFLASGKPLRPVAFGCR